MTTAPPSPDREVTHASLGRRIAAWLLDVWLASALIGVLQGIVGPGGWLVLTATVALLLMVVGMTWSFGATPGKLALGLRVVRAADGGRLSLPAVALREIILRPLVVFAWLTVLALLLVGSIGAGSSGQVVLALIVLAIGLLILIPRGGWLLHDRLTRGTVVFERSLPAIPQWAARPGTPPLRPGPPGSPAQTSPMG